MYSQINKHSVINTTCVDRLLIRKKGPNIIGRDIFYLIINKDGLLLPGQDDSESDYKNSCNSSSSSGNSGFRCAARVIIEGEMNY